MPVVVEPIVGESIASVGAGVLVENGVAVLTAETTDGTPCAGAKVIEGVASFAKGADFETHDDNRKKAAKIKYKFLQQSFFAIYFPYTLPANYTRGFFNLSCMFVLSYRYSEKVFFKTL